MPGMCLIRPTCHETRAAYTESNGDISVVHRLCHSPKPSYLSLFSSLRSICPSLSFSLMLSAHFSFSSTLLTLILVAHAHLTLLVGADTGIFVELRRIYAAPSLHNHRHVRDART